MKKNIMVSGPQTVCRKERLVICTLNGIINCAMLAVGYICFEEHYSSLLWKMLSLRVVVCTCYSKKLGSITCTWNNTRNDVVLAESQLNFNHFRSFNGNSNGRCSKKNKFKCLSFDNYLIFRKIISNKIFNDENNIFVKFNILNYIILFTNIYIIVSKKNFK